jgi:hypothetical protein
VDGVGGWVSNLGAALDEGLERLHAVLKHLHVLLVLLVVAQREEEGDDALELAAQAVPDRARDAGDGLDVGADLVGVLARLDVREDGADCSSGFRFRVERSETRGE